MKAKLSMLIIIVFVTLSSIQSFAYTRYAGDIPIAALKSVTVAKYNGDIYLCWIDKYDCSIRICAPLSRNSYMITTVPKAKSIIQPAMCESHGYLYITWVDYNGKINVIRYGGSFNNFYNHVVLDEYTNNTPAISKSGWGTVYLVWLGRDNYLYATGSDREGTGWFSGNKIGNFKSSNAPALYLSNYSNKLIMAWTGTDGYLRTKNFPFSTGSEYKSWFISKYGPCLTMARDRIYLGWVDENYQTRYMYTENDDFSVPTGIGSFWCQANNTFSLAYFEAEYKMIIAWSDQNSTSNVYKTLRF